MTVTKVWINQRAVVVESGQQKSSNMIAQILLDYSTPPSFDEVVCHEQAHLWLHIRICPELRVYQIRGKIRAKVYEFRQMRCELKQNPAGAR